MTNRSKEIRTLYGVSGVPTMIVNGKYRTTATMAGGNQQLLQVVDFLIQKERDAASKQAHQTAQ
jgi:thiol:disulfide interchange protein DsbA